MGIDNLYEGIPLGKLSSRVTGITSLNINVTSGLPQLVAYQLHCLSLCRHTIPSHKPNNAQPLLYKGPSKILQHYCLSESEPL